jgi:hypothetical protein
MLACAMAHASMITSSFHFIKSAVTRASLNNSRQWSNQHTIGSHHSESQRTAQIFTTQSILFPRYFLYIIQTFYNFKQNIICWRKQLKGIQYGIISFLFSSFVLYAAPLLPFFLLKEIAVSYTELPLV